MGNPDRCAIWHVIFIVVRRLYLSPWQWHPVGASLGTVMSFSFCNFIVLAMVYAAFGLRLPLCTSGNVAAVLGGHGKMKSNDADENWKTTKGKDAAATLQLWWSTSSASGMRNAMGSAWSLLKQIIPYVLLGAAISGFSAVLPACGSG
ncbi:hypothetical protein O9929_19670 [Vibrio lentus]|nr:hypothetical protein [Vibrio lentus]